MKKAVECLCVVASAVDSRLMVYWQLGGGSWWKGLVLGQGFASACKSLSQQKEHGPWHALQVGIWGLGRRAEQCPQPCSICTPQPGGTWGSAPRADPASPAGKEGQRRKHSLCAAALSVEGPSAASPREGYGLQLCSPLPWLPQPAPGMEPCPEPCDSGGAWTACCGFWVWACVWLNYWAWKNKMK